MSFSEQQYTTYLMSGALECLTILSGVNGKPGVEAFDTFDFYLYSLAQRGQDGSVQDLLYLKNLLAQFAQDEVRPIQ